MMSGGEQVRPFPTFDIKGDPRRPQNAVPLAIDDLPAQRSNITCLAGVLAGVSAILAHSPRLAWSSLVLCLVALGRQQSNDGYGKYGLVFGLVSIVLSYS